MDFAEDLRRMWQNNREDVSTRGILKAHKASDAPMGVSQWKNHGDKYGYSKFWENKILASEREKKDYAYQERDQLVAALSKLFPAWLGYHVGEWEDDWRNIIYIKLPTGQVSWHIHDSEKRYFKHLDPGIEEWDGHTTAEKYDRLRHLSSLDKGE